MLPRLLPRLLVGLALLLEAAEGLEAQRGHGLVHAQRGRLDAARRPRSARGTTVLRAAALPTRLLRPLRG